MDTFTVYVAIKANAPIDDSTVERVAGGFRPEDEEMCLWRDEYGASVLRISTDVQALTR